MISTKVKIRGAAIFTVVFLSVACGSLILDFVRVQNPTPFEWFAIGLMALWGGWMFRMLLKFASSVPDD